MGVKHPRPDGRGWLAFWAGNPGEPSALLGGIGEERVESRILTFRRVAPVCEERVRLVRVCVRAGDRRREREARGLVVHGTDPVLEERVVLRLAETLEGLPGKRLEGGPPLALLERGDVLRRARPGWDE